MVCKLVTGLLGASATKLELTLRHPSAVSNEQVFTMSNVSSRDCLAGPPRAFASIVSAGGLRGRGA